MENIKFKEDYEDYKQKLSKELSEREVNLMLHAFCMGYCQLSAELNEKFDMWINIDEALEKIKELGESISKYVGCDG